MSAIATRRKRRGNKSWSLANRENWPSDWSLINRLLNRTAQRLKTIPGMPHQMEDESTKQRGVMLTHCIEPKLKQMVLKDVDRMNPNHLLKRAKQADWVVLNNDDLRQSPNILALHHSHKLREIVGWILSGRAELVNNHTMWTKLIALKGSESAVRIEWATPQRALSTGNVNEMEIVLYSGGLAELGPLAWSTSEQRLVMQWMLDNESSSL